MHIFTFMYTVVHVHACHSFLCEDYCQNIFIIRVNCVLGYVLAMVAECSACMCERKRELLAFLQQQKSGCRLHIWGQCIQSLDTVWHSFFSSFFKMTARIGMCICVCVAVHV